MCQINSSPEFNYTEKLEVDDSVCLQSSSSTAESSKKDIITEANVKDGKCSITMEVCILKQID